MSTAVQQQRDNDFINTLVVKTTINIVKKNPIKVSMYILGILLFFFANGYSVSNEKLLEFQSKLTDANTKKLDVLTALDDVHYNMHLYKRSKGWFTCNQECKNKLSVLRLSEERYNKLLNEEKSMIQDAKQTIGKWFSSFLSHLYTYVWFI